MTFPFPFFPVSDAPPTRSYRTRTFSTSDLTNYSFSTVDIGTAAANRHVLVAVVSRSAATQSISSATIAGISASIAYYPVVNTGDGFSHCGFIIAAVPTGTEGTIAVNMTGACVRMGISVWAIYGLKSTTPFASASQGGASATLDLNTPTGGLVFGVTFGSSPSLTWTGITQDVANQEIENSYGHSVASDQNIVAATPRAVSRTGGGTGSIAAAISLR